MSSPILNQFGRPADYSSPTPSAARFKSTEDDRYRLDRPKLFDDMARLLGRDRYKALISDVAVFDIYQGPGVEAGRKSVALSVTLQPLERTLTEAEIEAIAARIVGAVTKATGAALRG
jgi:hypothetical protein